MSIKTIQLLGDEFNCYDEGGWVSIYLRSNPSLCGNGRTFQEAYGDVIKNFTEAKKHFNDTPISHLSVDAVEFRDWLNDSKRDT